VLDVGKKILDSLCLRPGLDDFSQLFPAILDRFDASAFSRFPCLRTPFLLPSLSLDLSLAVR
jgi:hypothetical protein